MNINLEKNEEGFSSFLDICKEVLKQDSPCRQKYTRGNHLPFKNKTLFKELMNITSLIFITL